MAARLDSQHTEAGLGIVEGDPLDAAGEHFPVGLIRSRRCSHSLEYPRERGSLANAGEDGGPGARAWVRAESLIKLCSLGVMRPVRCYDPGQQQAKGIATFRLANEG